MPREADFVGEVSTTTGTGSMTLTGAVAGYRPFLTAFGSGTTVVHYGIRHDTDGTFESGIGTYSSGANSLSRDLVLASSNSGSKVAFASGNKAVFVQRPAEVPMLVRIRRPTDIGLEIEPAAGQSAAAIRVKNTSGATAFSVDAYGGFAAGGGTMSGATPGIAFVETDVAAPAGRFRTVGVGGHLEIQRSTSGDFASVSTQVRLKSDGSIELLGAISAPGANIVAPLVRPSVADADGAIALTIGTARPWVLRQSGTGSNAHLELAATSTNRIFQIASDTGNSGFRFNVYSRELTLFGALNSEPFVIGTPGSNVVFTIAGVAAARVSPSGTALDGPVTIITREKGDARYSIASSAAALKRDIRDLEGIDLSALQPRAFIWDMEGHPRFGLESAGFLYEDVLAAFPQATYPERNGRPGGVDALALLAGFVTEIRGRLTALEDANGRKPRRARA